MKTNNVNPIPKGGMNMKTSRFINLLLAGLLVVGTVGFATAAPEANPERDCYFGDTHAHSMWSGDAFGLGNRLGPDNAYRFARGEEAYHVNKSGKPIKLTVPLDFFMMTDHSEMMGLASQALDKNSPVYNTELGKLLRAGTPKAGAKALFLMQNAAGSGKLPEGYYLSNLQECLEAGRCQCREVQRSGQVHDLHRLRMDLHAPGRQPAPQRDLPRHQGAGDALHGHGFGGPGASVDLPGRPEREGQRQLCHFPQRQPQRRAHVSTGRFLRRADRCRLLA